jgi:ELWxxDGT repeat protein
MKKSLLFNLFVFSLCINTHAQVTQINDNKSLEPVVQLSNTKVIAISAIDQTLWVTNGTLAGTIPLSTTITSIGSGGVLNGKYIFAGNTAATGDELFITDGTPAGTLLLDDIIAGATGSAPADDFVMLNGYLYFTAVTAATGRELWRTNGTLAGTSMIKDIFPGPTGSNDLDMYQISSAGNYLLFAAMDALSNGVELWKSDGNIGNAVLVKNINSGASLSSNPRFFSSLNNVVLFAATDAANGDEIWKTDGTELGTTILKDINPGADSSTSISIELAPGVSFPIPVFLSFHVFKSYGYFMANDGTGNVGIWRTDGTGVNTTLVKEMLNASELSIAGLGVLLFDAFNLSNKFMFPVSDAQTRFELWESDGTTEGTKAFKIFPANTNSDIPFIYLNIGFNSATQTQTYPLFNGKFFFSASDADSNELWSTDGTIGGTAIVKNINPLGNGIDLENSSYLYTSTGLFFAANDGTHGNELFKSNGTALGTSMVQDIYLNAGSAEPVLSPFFVNDKILFTATDGNSTETRDLFVVEGNFTPLPVQLLNFTVSSNGNDALLKWSTSQEKDAKDFTIQSSNDAAHWTDIGTMSAAGNSSVQLDYSFTDAGVMNSGKSIVYYRLILTDIDGKSANSKIISLKLKEAIWNVQLMVNPVKDRPDLLFTGGDGITKISIRDINGKTIYNQQLQNAEGLISLPVTLQRGFYILSVINNNQRKSIKFVKD